MTSWKIMKWVRQFWKDCSRAANQDHVKIEKTCLLKKRSTERFYEISWANENVSTAIAPSSSLPAVLPCWFFHIWQKSLLFSHILNVPCLSSMHHKFHFLTFDCFLYFIFSQVTTPNEWVIRSELVQTRDQDSIKESLFTFKIAIIFFLCAHVKF